MKYTSNQQMIRHLDSHMQIFHGNCPILQIVKQDYLVQDPMTRYQELFLL